MLYYLDKRGRPMEWVKGRRLSNFIRFLRYCRRITTERPDCMYPYWLCSNCGDVEDYVDGHRDDGNVCPKCSRSFLAYIEKRYKPLTEGTTKRASKEPTDRPRPDVIVPSQVAKRTDQESSTRLHRDIKFLEEALRNCEHAANGWLDDSVTFHGCCDALAAIKELRTKYDALVAERDELCAKMRQLCQAIDDEIPESPDIYDGLNVMSETDRADWENWYELLVECRKLGKAKG